MTHGRLAGASPGGIAAGRKDEALETEFSTGILPSQALRDAIAAGEVGAGVPIGDGQIQPASIDLRLGPVAYRVRASFLPGARSTVAEKIEAFQMYRIDLDDGAVLERHCVYIVPLIETLSLKKRTSAIANPKSSTGRLDVFARLITDNGTEFDRVREGYKGPLFAEISPRAFSIRVKTGTRLMQLRIRRGSPPATDAALRRLQEQMPLVDGEQGTDAIKNGLAFTVDCSGQFEGGIVGYRARRHAGLIDVERIGHYDPLDFWEPVRAMDGRGIILDPNDFYILASKEAVMVPADHAAEMLAYDTRVGEFRVHYAGFFDPGFGVVETGGAGSRAVLEVRSHEVPFLIEDGQVVGRLIYERLTARPDKLYGTPIGSSYQRQGLALGKQFKRVA
jgi:dCTP deaminase